MGCAAGLSGLVLMVLDQVKNAPSNFVFLLYTYSGDEIKLNLNLNYK